MEPRLKKDVVTERLNTQ